MADPTVAVPLGPETNETDGDNRPQLSGAEPVSLGDGFRMAESWLRYAAFGILLLVILVPILTFMLDVKTALTTSAAVILLLGAIIVALGGDRRWRIPRRFVDDPRNPFGSHLDLGSVGFGMLLIPFGMGVLNLLFTLFGAEPLFGIITTVVFIGLISLRYVNETTTVIRIGVAICLIAFAATRLVGNSWLKSDWVKDRVIDLMHTLPDLIWLVLVCVGMIVVVRSIQLMLRLNWPARLALMILVATIGLEIVSYTIDFSNTGVAGDGKSVIEATGDPFPSNNQVTEVVGKTGLCDKDGPDFWVALIRLAGMTLVGVLMFREHRRLELQKQQAGDPEEINRIGGFRYLHCSLLKLDGDSPDGRTGGVLVPHEPDDESDAELEEWAIHALNSNLLEIQAPLREYLVGQHLADLAREYPAFRKRQMIRRIVWEDISVEPMTHPRSPDTMSRKRLKEVFGPRGVELFKESGITKEELKDAHIKEMNRKRKAERTSPPPPPPPPIGGTPPPPPPPPPAGPSPTGPPSGGPPPPPPHATPPYTPDEAPSTVSAVL